ncbi:MAG: hypothetical protein AAFY25_00940 [Pseudomonadota bacterium]
MDMPAQLSELRRAVPGCHVAAFVDLSARMVLSHDARSKAPQERLDGLADRARQLLSAPGLPGVDHAMAISGDSLELFLGAGDDGLALVCGTGTDVEAALTHARAVLGGVTCDA